MNVAEQPTASKELITEILEKISKLNRQLPPTQEPALLATAPPVSSRSVPPTPVSRPASAEFKNCRGRKLTPEPAREKDVPPEPAAVAVSVSPPSDLDFGLRVHQRMLDMGLLPASRQSTPGRSKN